MAKKVYIGIGHGGSDPGGVANGFKEKDLNLAIGKACYDYLKGRGVEVKISRTSDVDVTIAEKAKAANAFKANVAMDIHCNIGGGDGAEVYYSKSGSGKSLGENILKAVKAIGQQSRGVKTKVENGKDYFGIIRQTNIPTVLVECAFMDSADVQIINTAAKQKAMGEAIAKGVLAELRVADKPIATQTVAAKTKITKGSVVAIAKNATYYNGKAIPDWVKSLKWIVKENPVGSRTVIDKSTDGRYSICSAVNTNYLTVVPGTTTASSAAKTIAKGVKVKVNKGAKDYNGKAFASWVYSTTYTVLEKPVGNRVVIGINGTVTAAVNIKDLTVVK